MITRTQDIISDEVLDRIIELRKTIDKSHTVLISDGEEALVELRDLEDVQCGFCKDPAVGIKHYKNRSEMPMCKDHIHSQGYYIPE